MVVVRTGRTLYDPDELVKANGGKPTMSIMQVQQVRGVLGLTECMVATEDCAF